MLEEKDKKIVEIEDLLSNLIKEKSEDEYLKLIQSNEFLKKYDELMSECETEKIDVNLLDKVIDYLKALKK